MTGEIICDESGSCKLDIEFGKMDNLPHDLISLPKSRSTDQSPKRRTSTKKQIKGSLKAKTVSTKVKPKARGRPKKTEQKKPAKTKKQSKQGRKAKK